MPDDLDAYLDPAPKSRGPRDRVHSIASRIGIPADIADDYLRLTRVESGHNVNVRDSHKGAQGFGQVMPDRKGGSTRTVGGRTYNLRDPDQNIEAGLRYFSEGGPDPTERRLYYFGGPRARDTYRRTRRIPNISDGNMTAAQYVRATGGQQQGQQSQQPRGELDAYLDPVSERNPPKSSDEKRASPKNPPVSARQSAPITFSGSGRAFGPPLNEQQREALRQSIAAYEAPQRKSRPSAPEIIDAGNSVEVDLATGRPKAPSRTQRVLDVLGKPSSGYDPRNALRYLLTDGSTPEQRQAEAERQQRVAQTGWGEYLAQAPKGIGIGLSTAAESGLKSIAVLAKKLDFGGEYEGKKASDLATYRAGEWIARNAREILSSNPDLEQDFIVGKAPQAIGQALSFLLGGVATKAPRLAVAVLGAGMTTADAYDEVRQRGGSDEEAVNAGLLAGAILGPTELIGTRRLMKALSGTGIERRLESALVQALRDGSRDAVENALQEIGQSYAQGKITGVSREAKQLIEEGLLAMIGSAGVTTPVSAIARRGQRSGRSTPASEAAPGKPVVRVRGTDGEFQIVGEEGDRVLLANRGSSVPTMSVPRSDVIEDVPLENYLDEPQTKVQPQAEASGLVRESVPRSTTQESAEPVVARPVEYGTETVSGDRAGLADTGDTTAQAQAQKFYHRDYGAVTESANQRRVGKGRVRVVAEDGTEHVIKRADMSGRGNQRAVPVRESGESKDVGEVGGDSAPSPASPLRERLVKPTITESVTEPRQPETTAPKNVAMAADREVLGLPELERSEPQAAQRVLDEAKASNQRDPRSTDRLITQALEGKKNFTNVETMQLNLRAAEIKNRANELQREIYETKDESAIMEKRAELDSLIDEFDRLSQAQRASGREWGRAGIARQRAIDEDYSLVGMVARFKAAAGREPKPAERAQIEQQSKRIAELETKLSAAEEQLAKKRLQGEIDRISRRQRRTQSKAQIDSEWADLKNQFAEIRQREASFFKSEEGSFDPEAVRLIGKMVRNRVQAGIVNAEQLVDEIHGIVGGDKRELRDAISGYRTAPAQRRSDIQRQIDALKSELRNISKSEDIAAGRRASRQEGPQREFQRDQARQRAIERQIADLEAQMASGEFRDNSHREPPRYTRETHALQKELDAVRAEYDRMKYRATASTGQKITDTALGLGNAPKTLLSMSDLSALLRQGGYGYATHPILSTQAARDMFRSFSERGFANVEAEIKSHPQFEEAKQNGVEFTGIDKLDPRLSKREEGYLGSGFIDAISKGKYNPLGYTVKPLKDVSERTFVSFLDSQRMRIYAQQASAIKSMKGLTDAQVKEALKAQAKLVNIATGRGSLGKRGNEFMPALNIAMFSPRLLASRIQLLNKMFNPVAWANTPKGARKLMMIDNAKFLGFTLLTLGLARAAGASVNLDPDDSEFLKIKVGNTRYDTLTGLQQPMRFFLRMVGYGGGQAGGALRGGEMYSGDPASDILLDFTRSKTSPEVGYLWDAIEGKNRLTGKKFDAKMDALKLAIPLPAQDFQEAIKTDGVARGFVEAMPSLVGIGSQTYQGAAEKATTRAEKLARRKVMQRLPDESRTQEEIDVDTKKSQLRARARRGEDVSADIAQLKGKLTERQIKGILAARSKTRLQEDVNRLGVKDALLVYSVANPQQRAEIKKLIDGKAGLVNTLPAEEQPEVRRRLAELGISVPAIRISRPTRESRQSRAAR